MSVEAMKAALEVLEGIGLKTEKMQNAIDLLRQALAQPDLAKVGEVGVWGHKREWVGLTDEERRGIREWQEIQKELGPVWAPMMLYLYDAIEAKLKEKNT